MRLIDAGALVEFLLKEIIECDKEYDEKSDHIILGAGQEAELIRDKVKEMPTVDIVRCKDCKYGHIDKWDGKYHCELNLHFEIVGKDLKGNTTYNCNSEWGADDFCSKGERRGEEDEID